MLRRLVSLLTTLALGFAGLVAIPTAATAAGSSSDATLSGLSIQANTGDGWLRTDAVRVSPSFEPQQTYYEAFSALEELELLLTPTEATSTVRVTGGDVTNATATPGNPLAISFPRRANNTVTITVTAPDAQTTKTYKINTSVGFMPQPELVSIAPTSFSTAGGDTAVAYVKHAFRDNSCNTQMRLEYDYLDSNGNPQRESDNMVDEVGKPDANGISMVTMQAPALYYAFRNTSVVADLNMQVNCWLADPISYSWQTFRQSAMLPKSLNFYNPTVSSVKVPDVVSQFTLLRVEGKGVNSDGYLDTYLVHEATGKKLWLDQDWLNSDSFIGEFVGWDSDVFWKSPRDVKLVIEHYNYEDDDEKVELFSKALKFTPRVATRVNMSPAKGPLVGGNVVKISGHFLCNTGLWTPPVITIGGKPVTELTQLSCDSKRSSTGDQYDGLDRYSFKVPPSTTAGPAEVSVDIGYGAVVISQKYVYGGKPVINSITPSSVANTGGSMVTIEGASFGISGTPIVTIGGEKSPYVVRVSDSKLLAMVPASAATGSVDLNVISSSGGGALDIPASITLVAASEGPTIKSISPATSSLSGGDSAVITGTGFSASTTGVTLGGIPAKVTAVTSTTLTIEVPGADVVGAANLAVGTSTGLAIKNSAFTYTANPGVTSVAPGVVKSTDTGNATKVTISGAGFGSKGTISIGGAKAIAYTSNGTTISGITIPTTKVGVVSLLITPNGSKSSFTTSVTVSGPVIKYVGPDPYDSNYAETDHFADTQGYAKATVGSQGGDLLRIEGKGFGSAGKVRFGTTLVTPISYTDTAIVFAAPSSTVGLANLTVVPATGTVTAIRTAAVQVGAGVTPASILEIFSNVDNTRAEPRNTFSPADDADDLFVVKGSGFLSTDNGAKTVVKIKSLWESDSKLVALSPVSVTATEVKFRAPRNLDVLNWYSIAVETKTTLVVQRMGIWYTGVAPTPTLMSPTLGLCTKESQGTYNPAVITATGDGVFGASGSVKLAGITLPAQAVTWSPNEVSVDLSKQSANLAEPWGLKEISFIPADSSKPVQNWNFNCAVVTSVTTKLNNSVAELTLAAGTAYTASATINNPLPGTTYVQPAGTYFYQSAADYAADPGRRNVKSGLPVAAGEWFVWANTGAATYDTVKYAQLTRDNFVKIIITGQAVTFTPKLAAGSGDTIAYRGQLGDGSNGSPNDIAYTNTATNDAITSVTWQHRNHLCAQQDSNLGWQSGLPSAPAVAEQWCGGDGTSVTSWEIRVASFEMLNGNVDRSIYYQPTYETFLLTITKRQLTINSVKAEKVYDGSTSIQLGELTVTGAVDGDVPTLDWNVAYNSTFVDELAGSNKQINAPGQIELEWGWRARYELANPNLALIGTIKKADAILKLTSSPSSVLLSSNTPIALTVDTLDSRNNQPISVNAAAATPVLVNKTPAVCSLNGLAVTALKAGDCIIEATQAASTNYNAAVSFKDDESNVEQLVIKVYGAPKVISVVADDIVASVGDTISASYSMAGLIDGDSFDNVEFSYYRGSTLLAEAPTEVGTYKIVPKAGALAAVDQSAYDNVVKYVAGKLVITPLPPTISAISPASGPEAGGNTVVINGNGLQQVTSINFGGITLRKSQFVVNGDGTSITLKAPKGTGSVIVTLNSGAVSIDTDYTYVPTPAPTAPLSIKLTLKLEIGAKFYGQKVVIKGGGLMPNSDYTLVMRSTPQTLHKAKTDANGNFLKTITIPAKACMSMGKHSLTLTGIGPDGKKATDTAFFVLTDKCVVAAQAAKSTTKSWTLNGFLFGYCQPQLNAGGISSLKALAPLLKGAKTITVYGYTETDTKSAAIKRSNIILAQGRTNSVVAFLKKLGVKAVYKTVAKGGVDPVSVKEQWKNRRVVIEATY
jgi:hypothetical protein